MPTLFVQADPPFYGHIQLDNGVVVTRDSIMCLDSCIDSDDVALFLARVALGAVLGVRRRLAEVAGVARRPSIVDPRVLEIPFFDGDDQGSRWLVEVTASAVAWGCGFALVSEDTLIVAALCSSAKPNVVAARLEGGELRVYTDEGVVARMARRLVGRVVATRVAVQSLLVWMPVLYGLYATPGTSLIGPGGVAGAVREAYRSLIPEVPFIATLPAIMMNPVLAAARVDVRLAAGLSFELNEAASEARRGRIDLSDKPLLARLILSVLRAYTTLLADAEQSRRISDDLDARITVTRLLRFLDGRATGFDVNLPRWLVNELRGLMAPLAGDTLPMVTREVLRAAAERGEQLDEELLGLWASGFAWRRVPSW